MREVTLTADNFKEEVLESQLPVLVDFWAPWCAPCRLVSPLIGELAQKYRGRLKVGAVDVDENQRLAAEYRIMSIPTLKIFKDGQVIKEMVGFQGKEALVKLVKEVIS